MKKDLLNVSGLNAADLISILDHAGRIKAWHKEGREYTPLKGKTLGMIFYKSSTRTRLSFEVGMYQLGGLAIFLSNRDIQLGRGETEEDTAKIMSRYLDGIMVRTFSQESVEAFARTAAIPVINGLTDLLHPCQILSDLFTIKEKKGGCEGVRIAYIGDGNNIANSWIDAALRVPIHLRLACPQGYDPDRGFLARGEKEAAAKVELFRDPSEAADGADVLYTDVWTSMGQEAEKDARAEAFRNFQINRRIVEQARKDAIVMHCLPAHRGEEITSEVIDGPRSVVLDQAENRLHVQKAVMDILMGGKEK
ncbi:MAG: ornithine carbamoyltransferase [Syntrophales bacterium]|nr:ornithine carbamoyltransferase [Syntrophales bacterium]MDD5232762.1 ornithine carbamoyltransferase [Syntrophales bacterium]MDD5533566.1 ornithine carbamoyltransferase [Syntrophales bacterium]HPL64279.1 ornithine carbamoyltransferase [Syntrophales bacterium]